MQNKKALVFGETTGLSKNIEQLDYITLHRIYNRLLENLANPRIKHRQSGVFLPYILHEKTKSALMSIYDFSKTEIAQIEADIFEFAEFYAPDYEIIRDAPSALFYDLKQAGETDLIFSKRAVAVPNFILNALLCNALENEFSRADILACNGFILREGYLRLDLDERLVRRGFITPEIDTSNGLIIGLRVFRYPKDEYPFILRTRSKNYISGGIN